MSKKKSVFIKVIVVVVLIIAVGGAVTIYKRDTLVENFIVLKLNKSLRDNTHSLYDYQLKNVKTSFIDGNFKINDFKIFIKPSALDSLERHHILKRQLVEIEFNSLQIKGIDINHFLSKERMIADEINLNAPQIKIFYNSEAPKHKTNKLDLDSIFSKIDPYISVNKVCLNKANLKIVDTQQDSLNTFGFSGFSFTMNDLKIDSSTVSEPLKIAYSSFTCGGGKTHLYLNNDYSLKMNDFNYSSIDKLLYFEDVRVKHTLTKAQFKKENPDDTPFYDVSFDKLSINLTIGDLLLNNDIELKHVAVDKLDVFVYQSKLKKLRPKKVKPLLSTVIRSIPLPVYIEEIDLKNCVFAYEYEEKAMNGKVLELSFDRSNINIKNFTNEPTYLAQNHKMELVATSYFLNKGRINLTASFDLTSKSDKFHIKGRLNKMKFVHTNSLVEVFEPIKFTRGTVHSLDFNFRSNKYQSNGKMDFHYSDIKLKIQKEDGHDKMKNRPILSLVANNVFRSNNEPGHKKYKQGTIQVYRDKHKSILNYVWQSIKSGLLSTISRSKKK